MLSSNLCGLRIFRRDLPLQADGTTAGGDGLTGDPAGIFGAEEGNDAGNLFRLCHTLHRVSSYHVVELFFAHSTHHLGVDVAGSYAVDADILPAQLLCQGAGKALHSGLGGGVVGLTGVALSYMRSILNLMTKQERYQKKRSFRYVDADSYSPLVQRLVHYLEKNYAKEILLDDMAAELDYHKSYLCVAFKRETQKTIVDCLNMIRIQRAVELIVGSDQSLPQIAAMCGFSSDSHFTRTFTKYVGVTPGHCRRVYPASVVYEPADSFQKGDRPSQFIYNVLAQKQITGEMLRAMDQRPNE